MPFQIMKNHWQKIEEYLNQINMHRLLLHLNNIAQVYNRQGRYEDALSNYEKSLAKNRRIFESD